MGTGTGHAGRLARRHRARRGRRARGVRAPLRALAARRPAREPDRLADHDRPQPRDRPDPPRADARYENRAAATGASRPTGGTHGRHVNIPRRAPRAHLHLLPPGARARLPSRPHPGNARRTDHRGDRARLPCPVRDDEQAPHTREAQDPRREHPVRRAARAHAARAARRRPRSRLPDLQRRLGRRPHRPRRRSHTPRARTRRADARRSRSKSGSWR